MIIADHDTISRKVKNVEVCYEWVDYILKNSDTYCVPTKIRMPMEGTDYYNVMPCAMPKEGVLGVKVVTRNEKRHKDGGLNIDSQLLLYSYEDEELIALMDANWITTMRTAAVAVHSMLNFSNTSEVIAMIGLGNIGTAIGDILFPLIKDKSVTVKLFEYKNQAERFANRYSRYCNINFEYCSTYDELMIDSDVIFSSVTYAEHDFCTSEVYKKGCTVIPVHLRGFMECDKSFDHVITSDLESIKKFKYYNEIKKLSLVSDVICSKDSIRTNPEDRVIAYNLGIAVHDIYFAKKIYDLITEQDENNMLNLSPKNVLYI